MSRIGESSDWIVETLFLHGGRLSVVFANPEEAPNSLLFGEHPIAGRRKGNSRRTIE